VKELETHWPCGCYSYREDDKFYIKPCSLKCTVYLTAIQVSKDLGTPIRFQKVTETDG